MRTASRLNMSLAVSSIEAGCFQLAMIGVLLGTIAADRFPLSVGFLPFHWVFLKGKREKERKKKGIVKTLGHKIVSTYLVSQPENRCERLVSVWQCYDILLFVSTDSSRVCANPLVSW